MSYRTIKRVLGETSLELKFYFLLGGGLMLLIIGSFYIHARLNAALVRDQNKAIARLLVAPIILEKHWESSENDPQFRLVINAMADEMRPTKVVQEYSGRLYKADFTQVDPGVLQPDDAGFDALELLKADEPEVIDLISSKDEYNYYAPVRASSMCVNCHKTFDPDVKKGALIGMAKITFSLAKSEKALARNNAILWTTAIVTTFLAMLGAYAVVRYVIVKPVLHLKEVSDEIARGRLDLRADIRTGDEFEELSHAFNRMLRHLTTTQDELREVNTNLDAKVDELAHVNLRLYEMNKLKDEFLATMSHELRTPLNSILGFSDVLAGADNLNNKQHRFVNNIQTSGRELMVLISDVLDLAKIESGKMELQLVEFTIDDLVARQVNSMAPLAEKKNIDLTRQIDSGMPSLYQDPSKLQQILNNLLSNAIKFTPEGGRVRVAAGRCDEASFELVVEDTGIGIPLEEQETIFEKFRQGRTIPGQRDPMTREYGGSGLGLSIIKELTKLLGGELLLDSEFGKGSTFTVRLPFRLDDRPTLLDEKLHDQTTELEPLSAVQQHSSATQVVSPSTSTDGSPSTVRSEERGAGRVYGSPTPDSLTSNS